METRAKGGLCGSYHAVHRDSRGNVLWEEDAPNQLFNQGQFAILDIALRNGTAPASWYIGLMKNTLASMPAVNSTLSSLNAAGPYELTNGSDPGYSARLAVNRDNTAAGWPTLVASGSGEKATTVSVVFTNTGGVTWADTVRWMFMTTVATAGDTTGLLVSLAQLSSDRLLGAGDTLTITYSLTLT